MCACILLYCMCIICVRGGQKKILEALELESSLVVRHSVWVLGAQPESSARSVPTLGCWLLSPAPRYLVNTT